MENITIEKEDDGVTFDITSESSIEDDIVLNKRPKRQSLKKSRFTNRKNEYSSFPKPQIKRNVQQEPLGDDTFEMLANPQKKMVQNEDSDDDEMSNYEQNTNQVEENEYEEPYEEMRDTGEIEIPSPGYNSILDEKNDLIYKLYRIQLKGVPINKKFTTNSSINELRNEYNKIKRDMEVNASIKFSRRMLMACVTGVEFLNKRYDPFDVKLEGWSESVMEGIDDYDNVFERLHDKYASKVAMAPEIELLLTLTGSAFMFHLTNSMFKSIPNINEIAKQNPEFMKNVMQSMSQATSGSSNINNVSNSTETSKPANENGKREMSPPLFDLSHLSSMMGQGPLPVIPPPESSTRPIISETIPKNKIVEIDNDDLPLSVNSDNDDSLTDSIKNISFSDLPEKPKKRVYKRKNKS
tara:strand:+ start:1651 stop:2880 length:1230 start_codon:yes stop_codon:yes gene_type:complete